MNSIREFLRLIQLGVTPQALRFQFTTAIIDFAIIVFFIIGPTLPAGQLYLFFNYVIACFLVCDLIMRMLIATNLKRWLLRPMTWIDLVVLGTLMLPILLSNFAFLRAFRIWSLCRSKAFILLVDRAGCAHREDLIRSVINLVTLIFLIAGFVYTSFFIHNPGFDGFIDALYFTVTTITTTGFGDITLPGTMGKLTSIVTMIVGVSLFVRLAQTIVRPLKVLFPCPQCGLQRHEHDAIHCKACGTILNIPDDGL